jgi:hypothetical protein
MTRKRTSEKDLVASATGGAATARRKASARPRAKRAAEPLAAPVAAAPETAAPETAPGVTIIYEPTYDEIAALAYSYWESRGFQDGSPEEDWLRAEAELRVRASAAVA